MEKQTNWIAIGVVVIVAVVAAYIGSMIGQGALLAPSSSDVSTNPSGGTINVQGKVSEVKMTRTSDGAIADIRVVLMDPSGNTFEVKPTDKQRLQFVQGKGKDAKPKLVGVNVKFDGCQYSEISESYYDCTSKTINPPANQ